MSASDSGAGTYWLMLDDSEVARAAEGGAGRATCKIEGGAGRGVWGRCGQDCLDVGFRCLRCGPDVAGNGWQTMANICGGQVRGTDAGDKCGFRVPYPQAP